MKKHLLLQLLLAVLIGFVSSCQQQPTNPEDEPEDLAAATAGPTTVYLVRNAERDVSDPSNRDTGLTKGGEARAEALRTLLQSEEVDALFTTKYLRAKSTIKPLAEDRHLDMLTYSSNDFNGLKKRLLQEHRGETVVVVAHSDTLLPLVAALGAKSNVNFIGESDYTYLFKVVLNPDKTASVVVDHYN